MMAKIGNKLIAVCSAAIGIIYSAGYVVTESVGTEPSELAMAQSALSATNPPQTIPTDRPSPSIAAASSTPTPTSTQTVGSMTPIPTLSPVSTVGPVAAATIKPVSTPIQATPTATPASSAATSTSTSASSRQTTPVSTPTPALTASKQKYQDGEFTGSGTNRFGTVEISLSIKKGKITSVDIISCRTRYPQRYINSLPEEVIARQDYRIDTVSGATRSSEDFISAVYQALKKAQQA